MKTKRFLVALATIFIATATFAQSQETGALEERIAQLEATVEKQAEIILMLSQNKLAEYNSEDSLIHTV